MLEVFIKLHILSSSQFYTIILTVEKTNTSYVAIKISIIFLQFFCIPLTEERTSTLDVPNQINIRGDTRWLYPLIST